jgi:hypothetical protein
MTRVLAAAAVTTALAAVALLALIAAPRADDSPARVAARPAQPLPMAGARAPAAAPLGHARDARAKEAVPSGGLAQLARGTATGRPSPLAVTATQPRLGAAGRATGLIGPPSLADSARTEALNGFGEQIAFEPGAGRAPRGADFMARGHGYSLLVGPTRTQIAVGGGVSKLTTTLLGAARDAHAEGEGRLAQRVNSYVGQDERRWRTGLATYARIRYRGVYRGVDVIYHGGPAGLEYDFVVRPGADPGHIRLALGGAESVSLPRAGDLIARAGSATFRQQRPRAYQVVDGRHRAVAARFVLDGSRVRFQLGPYDHSRTLVIDPLLEYSDFIGNAEQDITTRTRVDDNGNVYVIGSTDSASIPGATATADSQRGTGGSAGQDVYVMKIAPSGARQWITYLGGDNADLVGSVMPAGDAHFIPGGDIDLDGSGRPYLTGTTSSTDFPVTDGAGQTALYGPQDAFVTSLDTSGALLYSTYVGTGDGGDPATPLVTYGNGIAVEGNGVAYVGITSESSPTTSIGYLLKMSTSGVVESFIDLPWSGGHDTSTAVGVEHGCQSGCDVFWAGQTHASFEFPPPDNTKEIATAYVYRYSFTSGAVWGAYWFIDSAGGVDVAALDVNDNGDPSVIGTKTEPAPAHPYVVATRFDGAGNGDGTTNLDPFALAATPDDTSYGLDITHDAQDNVYLALQAYAATGALISAIQPTFGGSSDGNIVKYFPDGPPGSAHTHAKIVWQTLFGGPGHEWTSGIATGAGGRTYIVGGTGSDDTTDPAFPVQDPTQQGFATGGFLDGYIAVIRTNTAKIDTANSRTGASQTMSASFKYNATKPTDVTYAASESSPTFECRLRGPNATNPNPPFASCATSGQSYPGPLADGAYKFDVRAIDGGGTTSGAFATQTFKVDTTPPEPFGLTDPAPDARDGARPEFKWNAAADATSGVAKYRVVLDGTALGETTACCSFTPGADLAQGTHTWKVVATDNVGLERESETRNYTVALPANARLTISPNPVLAGRQVTFDGTGSADANHAIKRYEWDLDGDGTYERDTGATGATTATYPTPGNYFIGLRVTDVADLTATTSAELRVSSAPDLQKQFGVTINNEARFTRTPDVVVTATFPSFATSMLLSNDGGFLHPTTFKTQKETRWKLDSSGPERLPKTVYVRFLAGTLPSETFTDDIILDEIPPVVQQASVAPAAGTASARSAHAAKLGRWKVKLKAKDSNSGVAKVQVTASKRKPGKLLRYSRKLTVRSAKRPKFVRARDKAGNFSKWKKAR